MEVGGKRGSRLSANAAFLGDPNFDRAMAAHSDLVLVRQMQ